VWVKEPQTARAKILGVKINPKKADEGLLVMTDKKTGSSHADYHTCKNSRVKKHATNVLLL
jgi:hypothetical protein